MKIPQSILDRKGARKAVDIPSDVLELLNAGQIETANLTEWLTVDQLAVLKTVLKKLKKTALFPHFEEAVKSQKKISANNNTKVIGSLLSEHIEDPKVADLLSNHDSDIVRSWACWAITTGPKKAKAVASKAKPFAADKHFGVREVVIFATKEKYIVDLKNAVSTLSKWTKDKDENVRRYAVETLRPVGVWTKKIAEFQENPELGISILEPLKSDPSRYVQDAVANWLNDASKSSPDWVKNICKKWAKESDSKATAYIIKRGLRTINK